MLRVVALLAFLAAPVSADTIKGVVVDSGRQPVPGAEVRVVGASFVVVVHAGPTGKFEVANLPAGDYRTEVGPQRFVLARADGDLPDPPGIRPRILDRAIIRCCLCAMARRELPSAPLRTGHVDITTTAQGIVVYPYSLVR